MRRLPRSRSGFFAQQVLKGQISLALRQRTRLARKVLNLANDGRKSSIAGKPALASFHELLRQDAIQFRFNGLLTAEREYGVLGAQNFQREADLVFCRPRPQGCSVQQHDFIKAIRNYLPMQRDHLPTTWADASLLQSLTGYKSQTPFRNDVAKCAS